MNTKVSEVIKAAVAEREQRRLSGDRQLTIKAAGHGGSICDLYTEFLN